jgi:hypothetical protein
MAKKVYDSYLKTWFYEQDNGKRTLEPQLEARAEATKVEAPKKKWWQFWK